MSTKIAKNGFLAILTFIAFTVPLILADEVSLFANWLFIFISWLVIILITAIQPLKSDTAPNNNHDEQLKD